MVRLPRTFRALVAIGVLLCLASSAVAAGASSQLEVTDPSQAGPDYLLQGEYVGACYTPDCGCVNVGLQVVAKGNGQFTGVWYRGGLPGAGWDRYMKSELQGATNQDGAAILENDWMSVTVDGAAAKIQNVVGQPLGQLHKTHRVSSTMGSTPPANATVLFDGRPPEFLEGAKLSDDGLLMPGVTTTMPVTDFRLHLEFRTPFMPESSGQKRGNSGVYIQRRYELQILDSFGLEGVENECGGLYKQTRPDVNMALPPLTWQTYDIHFTAARFDSSGNKLCNARITAYHNGVAIHCDREIATKTGAGRPEGAEPLPIHLQFHGDPVRFRNVWIVTSEAPSCQPCPTQVVRRPATKRPLARRPVLRRLANRRRCR